MRKSIRDNALEDFEDMIVVMVIQARNLVGKDVTGASDPYTVVRYGNTKKKTKIIPQNLFPVWNQEFAFKLSGQSKSISFKVKDWNRFGPSQFLGKLLLDLKDLQDHDEADYRWHALQANKKCKTKQRGEIQIALKRYSSTRETDIPSLLQFRAQVECSIEMVHSFQLTKFIMPIDCGVCQTAMYGLLHVGLRCSTCQLAMHKNCIPPPECRPREREGGGIKLAESMEEDEGGEHVPQRYFGLEIEKQNLDQKQLMPDIVSFLLNLIVERGGKESEGIFRLSPATSELKAFMQNLEQNGVASFSTPDTVSAHVAATALKAWLRSLPNPIIEQKFFNDCVEIGRDGDLSRFQPIFSALPILHKRVVASIVTFLRSFLVAEVIEKTKMTSDAMSVVFAPCFLRNPTDDLAVLAQSASLEKAFVKLLLEHWDPPAI